MVGGTIVKGEANIPTLQNQISEVYFEHEVRASHQAIQAINEADLIVLGIGSLFTSILPNLIIKDIAKAINESKSPVVYYCNIMSETGETDSYCLEDHVEMIEKHGVKVDGVVRANDTIPNYLIDIYKKNNQQIVQKLSMKHSYKIIEKNLLIFDQNFVRHSPEKIKNTFMEVYKEMRE